MNPTIFDNDLEHSIQDEKWIEPKEEVEGRWQVDLY